MGALFYLVCALITVAHGVSLAKHQDHKHESEHEESHGDMLRHKIAAANAHFAIDVYKHCATRSPSKNVFFSPVSISSTLAMLSLGAKSVTHKQIIEGLGFNITEIKEQEIHEAFGQLLLSLAKKRSDLTVNIGNALFLEDNLELSQNFKKSVKKHYHAEILSSNFSSPQEAVKQINDYVEKHTNGKIVDLVKDLDEDTKMVLTNYIYFKGKWEYPFQADLTQVQNFSVDSNTTVEVPMMTQTKVYYVLFDKELPCSVVRLPYKGKAHMLLILPDSGKMKEVEDNLSKETIRRWYNQSTERFIEMFIPKLSISPSFELKEILVEMGLTDMFTDHADLSGISDGPPLKVSKAVHKAVLDINEAGTEAAAATFMDMVPTALFPQITLNSPFLLMINTEKDHQILFMGKVVNPLEK